MLTAVQQSSEADLAAMMTDYQTMPGNMKALDTEAAKK
jgi:hypothetical protein